jgi:AraC-like DNA-binding protein
MRDKVRELIWMMLPTEGCSIQRMAARLGTNRRTLHRRLRREGATYSGLIDAVRAEMVTHYLENREQPLQVVAAMLGFSALSVFSRWFRSRFGCSVSACRAGHRPGLLHPPARPRRAAAARGGI